MVHDEQHGIDTLLTEQVRLRLFAVTQNRQLMGVFAEPHNEISDDGAALLPYLGTDNVGKAEDPALPSEQVLKCGDHRFAAEFGGAIE